MNEFPVGYHAAQLVGWYKDSDNSGPYFLDANGQPSQGLPSKFFTDENGAGPNSRLRVDVAQTGFFAGREFRTFQELNIALAAVHVIKVVVPINVILFGLELYLDAGHVDLETVVGGTEGGVFATVLPVFPRNTMSERPTPIYTPVVVLTSGGTHTGGTVLDVLTNKTAANPNFSISVGAQVADERGIGAGTYYFRLTGVEASTGIIKARWEERP